MKKNLEVGEIFKGSLILDIIKQKGSLKGQRVRLRCQCKKVFISYSSYMKHKNLKYVSCDDCKKERNQQLIRYANKFNVNHIKNKAKVNLKKDESYCSNCETAKNTKENFTSERGRTCHECRKENIRKNLIRWRARQK